MLKVPNGKRHSVKASTAYSNSSVPTRIHGYQDQVCIWYPLVFGILSASPESAGPDDHRKKKSQRGNPDRSGVGRRRRSSARPWIIIQNRKAHSGLNVRVKEE